MVFWQYLLIVGGGLILVALACLLPGRFFRFCGTLALNAGLGLALLLALNFFTDTQLPLNPLTLSVSAALGLPGMAALAVIAGM